MFKLKEIKNNSIHKSMLKAFSGKDILFLENDNGLFDSAGSFEIWLIENKIKYNVLYNVSELPLEYIKGQIECADVIAFETTWTYKISKDIKEFLISYKRKKLVVECYIDKPTWCRKPVGVIHDMYVLGSYGDDMDEWYFKKLRINKGTWED